MVIDSCPIICLLRANLKTSTEKKKKVSSGSKHFTKFMLTYSLDNHTEVHWVSRTLQQVFSILVLTGEK